MSNCIVLAISKLTKKFHIFESNHLIAAFLDDKVDWVQLIIQHFFLTMLTTQASTLHSKQFMGTVCVILDPRV